MEKCYVVPDGMLKAGTRAVMKAHGWADDETYPEHEANCRIALEAALRWLDAELAKMVKKRESINDFYRSPSLPDSYHDNGYNVAIHDIRRMFLAEPEVPEEVKDLLWQEGATINTLGECLNDKLLEAFRRGQRSKG